MTTANLAALAGVLTAAGTLVASFTALIVALHAHSRIDSVQSAAPSSSPPPPPGVKQ
jgi:hypothetical protein